MRFGEKKKGGENFHEKRGGGRRMGQGWRNHLTNDPTPSVCSRTMTTPWEKEKRDYHKRREEENRTNGTYVNFNLS